MRLALYIRVSDESRQADNFSLETQLHQMRQWASDNGHCVIGVFIETASASDFGGGLDRTELGKVRHLARTHQIDALMYFKPDRFTRSLGDGILLRRELSDYGVELWCYYPHPHKITDDMELSNILEDDASARYVQNLREAGMRGRRGKAEAGIFNAARPPYGYYLEGKKRDVRMLRHAEHAAIVELIAEWADRDNLSSVQIADKLTAAGIPTPGSERKDPRRKKGPTTWTQPTVYRILTDETYTGTWYAGRYQGMGKNKKTMQKDKGKWLPIAVPVIIPRDKWERIQAQLRKRDQEQRKPERVKQVYLMARRVRCGCGYHMSGQVHYNLNGTFRTYYKCSTSRHSGGSCGAPPYRTEPVDRIVWQFASERIHNPNRLFERYHAAQKADAEHGSLLGQQLALVAAEIANYTAKLESVLDQRERANVHTVQEALDRRAAEYGQIIEALEVKRTQLAAQREEAGMTPEQLTELAMFAAEMRDKLAEIEASNDLAAKRLIIERLDLRVTLRQDQARQKWVDIHWLGEVQLIALSEGQAE